MRKTQRAIFERLWRQSLKARRRMIRDDELLTEEEFCQRRCISVRQLSRLLASGAVFSVGVDGRQYYPALLADPGRDNRRLATICRILWPARPHSRLHFLTARNAALGGITPLEAMRTDDGYRKVLAKARGWASQWSRTIVRIYEGDYARQQRGLSLACTAVTEIDPRISIWRRALDALNSSGNVCPDGPYAKASAVTAFIFRSMAGKSGDDEEVRLDIFIEKGIAYTAVVAADFARTDLDAVDVDAADDVVCIVRKIIAHASRHNRSSSSRG